MSTAFTTTGQVSYDQAAYDRLVYKPLRAMLHFDSVASVKPTRQAMPGTSVIFNQHTELAVATATLDESTDVDGVAMANGQVTINLVEKGNAVTTTRFLEETSMVEIDPVKADAIAWNAGESLDTLAKTALAGGSNIRYAGGGTTLPTGRTSVEPEDTLTGNNCRRAVAELRGAKVMPFENGYYRAYIHPDVSYDLRGSTGGANWRDVHTYSSPAQVASGQVDAFEGAVFLETPYAPLFADAGSSTTLTDVYATIWVGQQSLAKAYSLATGEVPRVVIGPITDKLNRFRPLGWYWIGGYARFREAAIRRVESSSSIGTNS